MMNTLSKSASSNWQAWAMAFRICRSFTRTVKPVKPSLHSMVVVAPISSISARLVASPRMSMSHWVNWRKRPFWGRSARHTLPICSALKGLGSWAMLLA